MDITTETDILTRTLVARLVELHGRERAAELLLRLARQLRESAHLRFN